jgi:uncharacterized membrane protein
LTVACAAAALVLMGVAIRPGVPPAPLPVGLVIFDTFLGVGGFIIMGGAGVWLWRRCRRDLRALAGATSALAVVVLAAMLRLVLFAQADYDRGRLPAAAAAGLVVVLAACVLWWADAYRRE